MPEIDTPVDGKGEETGDQSAQSLAAKRKGGRSRPFQKRIEDNCA
jgi:hypothetical protein